MIRGLLVTQDIETVILSMANWNVSVHHNAKKYKLQEKVERLFNNLKQFQFRRIATNYK